MQLIIMTPTKKEVHEVEWAECNTPTGNYVIQQGHAPMILSLSEKQPFVYSFKNGKEVVVMVSSGIVQITRMQVTVLLSNLE